MLRSGTKAKVRQTYMPSLQNNKEQGLFLTIQEESLEKPFSKKEKHIKDESDPLNNHFV